MVTAERSNWQIEGEHLQKSAMLVRGSASGGTAQRRYLVKSRLESAVHNLDVDANLSQHDLVTSMDDTSVSSRN
jgi:hypothetical protein